jgi:ABC-2 type transport system permease protein
MRLVAAAALAQLRMTRRNVEHLMPIFTTPPLTLVTMAILMRSGRADLAGWALVATLLMTVGQMGLLVAGDIVADERRDQTLELVVASPAPYFLILLTRIIILTSIGLVGFFEGWLIVRFVFGVPVVLHHPLVFGATVLATIFAAACTMLVAASVFCFARTTRTYQNAVGGPLYLIGGVLVPVTFLPGWIQPFSRGVFFYWSADLLRGSFEALPLEHVPLRLAAILLLGLLAWLLGAILLRRMLDHLRREGTLGLA